MKPSGKEKVVKKGAKAKGKVQKKPVSNAVVGELGIKRGRGRPRTRDISTSGTEKGPMPKGIARKRKDTVSVPVPPKPKRGARAKKVSVCIWQQAIEEHCPGFSRRITRSIMARAKARMYEEDKLPCPTKCKICGVTFPTVKEFESHRPKCCRDDIDKEYDSAMRMRAVRMNATFK